MRFPRVPGSARSWVMGIRSCPRSAGAASSDSANAACDRPGRHPQSLAGRPPQPVPRASRQRAGQGKPVGSAGRSLGRRAASSRNEPGRSYDTHEHLLKYVLSIVLAEPKTADGDRIDIARGPLDELVPRLRLARAAAMDKLASLSSPAIASESTPSIRRAAAANRSRPLATALEHGRLRAEYV